MFHIIFKAIANVIVKRVRTLHAVILETRKECLAQISSVYNMQNDKVGFIHFDAFIDERIQAAGEIYEAERGSETYRNALSELEFIYRTLEQGIIPRCFSGARELHTELVEEFGNYRSYLDVPSFAFMTTKDAVA